MSVNKLSVRALVKKVALSVPKPDSRWASPDAFIGLEIETEACNILNHNTLAQAGWTYKEDGSLRNSGIEFVFDGPKSGKAISTALDTFFDDPAPVVYTPNPRAAIHIHINWLDDDAGSDIGALRKLITLMYCIEPAVFEWVDSTRKWCGFAAQMNELSDRKLRSLMTADSASGMSSALSEGGSSGRNRYFGLNLAALLRYGTVEFRYFPCVTDKESVERWINFVMLAKIAAVEYPEDHEAMIQELSTTEGIRAFVTKWFAHSSIGTNLLGCLDIDQAAARMIDFGYLIQSVPARDAPRVRSAAAERFFQKSFPTFRQNTQERDTVLQDYRAALENELTREAYERLVSHMRQAGRSV